MARIFLETSDSARTANDNNDTFFGLAGDQVVTVKAKGITVDAAVERLVFTGQMSEYTFKQSGPNALQVLKGADLVTTAFVQSDANGTQLTFANGTVNAVLGASSIVLGGTAVSTTAGAITPVTIDTTITTPGDVTPPSTDSDLTVDQDNIVGTGGVDTFTGYIFDNQNTLQNGDVINGGAGTDTLNVEIGNSQNFAIQPRITDVEKIFIQAQATDIRDEADNFNTLPDYSPLGDQGAPFNYDDASHDGYTQIDAGKIAGVRQLWSDDSRANLVIEDVSVDSHLTTIGMRDTDPGNVNYEVYFDPQNITGPGAGAEGATLTIRLADVLALEVTGNGLNELPYNGINLNIGGASVVLAIDFAQFNSSLDPYGDLVDAMQASLNAQGYSSITVTESPEETAVFSITVTDQGNTYLQGTTANSLFSPIVLTNSGPESISMVGYTLQPGTVEPSGNLVRTAIQNEASTTPSLTQVDVILDNVARGDISGSGDLVIGDMSESGIQQFNVQVDRSSHLDQMASTNNVLEVINVENIGANGDLRINRIDDVRVFDASTMIGDVTLGAYLSEDVTGKYLDLQDIAADPAADNSEIPYLNVVDTEFSYDLGTGDDTLDLAISANNFAEAGTTNREDFVLEVNGNDGDDDITLSIVDGFIEDDNGLAYGQFGNGTELNWYANSNLNANLTINGGAGDDTISKPGSGNVVINAGSGNDTVYADNTGDKAAFVFNVAAPWYGLNALGSDANDSYRIFKGTLTVNFQGFNVTVNLANTTGVVSDLQVNQAIKDAINNNDVLNKLLVANDGPANTLVVTSLIDGELAESDLSVSIAVPTTLSTAEVALLNSYYATPGGTAADHIATFNASLAAFNLAADYETNFGSLFFSEVTGSDSEHTSDNIITPGTGNDVIVLGTGEFSNDTVVYEGYVNGTDSIVNFDSTTTITSGWSGGSAEVVTLTFVDSDGDPAAETILFDGVTVNLSAPTLQGVIPALDVATQFMNQYNAAAATNNWVATKGAAAGEVILTNDVYGNVTDLVATDFTGNYFAAAVDPDGNAAPVGIAITQGTNAPGTAATASTFTVTYTTATTALAAATNLTGINTVPEVQGDGALTLANKVAAEVIAGFTAGSVVAAADGSSYSVTFTATTLGAVAIPAAATAAAFGVDAASTTDSVNGTFVSAVGVDATTVPPVFTTTITNSTGLDYLDFSSYDVAAVFVGAVNITGGAVAVGAEYVLMTESTTNDGSYTIAVYTEAGATDTLVGTVGVADFGVEQAFVAENFII